MKTILSLLALTALCLVSCSTMTPDEHAAMMSMFQEMLANGTITQEQFDAFVAALNATTGIDWAEFITGLGLAVVSILTGTRIIRGPAKKISPADWQEIVTTYKSLKAQPAPAPTTEPTTPPQ